MQKRDIAEQYCREFPETPTMTLARKMYADNIEVWSTLEAARAAVRYVRGAIGKKNRASTVAAGKDHLHREPGEAGQSGFPDLPEPIGQLEDNPHHRVDSRRILVLADTQIPYHDNRAIGVALKWGEGFDPDCIVMNGDIMDCYSLSSYDRDPRERDFPREIDATRQFLDHVRGRFPRARIIFKDGNHEERYIRYLYLKAPELFGMKEVFEFPKIMRFVDLGIEYLDRMRHIKVGRLNIIHGHEFRGGGTANPARWLYLRANSTAMCGHFHRTSNHTETSMDGKPTSTWSTGCLCNLNPRYMRYNRWNHGFAAVESDGHNFRVHNLRIVEGEVY